jgi:3-deoxy-manno-octulosonate cytidylyltransferase (CMP-KDO synthetase)
MKVIAIIPARMKASRFPNKPLAKIAGMPMLGHCWHRTRMTRGLTETYIATCDDEIMNYAASIGAKAIMTADTHNRATERTIEAMTKAEHEMGSKVDAVVMVQGDEPLIMPEVLEMVLEAMCDPSPEIINLMETLETDKEFRNENNVKVVTNKAGDALYFSREPIPSSWKKTCGLPMRKQTGIIGFKRDALLRFNETAETILELCESVDMNRVLENGGRIRMVLSPCRTVGVDTPADLGTAEKLMKNDALFPLYGQTGPC